MHPTTLRKGIFALGVSLLGTQCAQCYVLKALYQEAKLLRVTLQREQGAGSSRACYRHDEVPSVLPQSPNLHRLEP